jgi:regulator of protease activity HflC (stomatin/prohibitin superfamily)
MIELVFGAVAVFLGVSVLTGVRLLQEYERAVIFRLGRARKELASPGVNFLLPWGIDRVRVVDIRTKAIQIPPQEVITHDNISISVDAVVYASVASPSHAVLEVEQFMPATLQLAATTLRAVLGKMDLDEILAHRDRINNEIRTILDTRTEQWGVEISAVEIKDIQLPREMQRAMARQAEAERERRAKVIAAEGEVQAASKLAEAAAMIAVHPGALQLRLYQTLVEVSAQASSTIVFPVPFDFSGQMGGGGSTPQQLQTMMQSAVALASAEKAKQLAAASMEDALPAGTTIAKRNAAANAQDQARDEAQERGEDLGPARRR